MQAFFEGRDRQGRNTTVAILYLLIPKKSYQHLTVFFIPTCCKKLKSNKPLLRAETDRSKLPGSFDF